MLKKIGAVLLWCAAYAVLYVVGYVVGVKLTEKLLPIILEED